MWLASGGSRSAMHVCVQRLVIAENGVPQHTRTAAERQSALAPGGGAHSVQPPAPAPRDGEGSSSSK